jgi:REP element-mobilizing transposase RayT
MSYNFAGGFKIRDQHATHFLTFTVVGWIDIFTRQCYRDLIIENLKFCRENKRLELGAFVIMSNHLHLIWTSANGNLSALIRDFKAYTSKEIVKLMMSEKESRKDWLRYMFTYYGSRSQENDLFKVWTSDNHPEEIQSEKFGRCKLDYIHDNPVRAGLVTDPEHYIYSSAANYQGQKGIIDIDFLY